MKKNNDLILREKEEAAVYTVTLTDGTELAGLTVNGDNFISRAPVDADIFEGNLSPVIVTGGDLAETHEAMKLVHLTKMGGEYWFTLRDVTAEEQREAKVRADIDYLAMMTDTDLEEA